MLDLRLILQDSFPESMFRMARERNVIVSVFDCSYADLIADTVTRRMFTKPNEIRMAYNRAINGAIYDIKMFDRRVACTSKGSDGRADILVFMPDLIDLLAMGVRNKCTTKQLQCRAERVMVHELTHVQQMRDGRLVYNEKGTAYWNGASWSRERVKDIDTRTLPWEREAIFAEMRHEHQSDMRGLMIEWGSVYGTRDVPNPEYFTREMY